MDEDRGIRYALTYMYTERYFYCDIKSAIHYVFKYWYHMLSTRRFVLLLNFLSSERNTSTPLVTFVLQ